ncbi:hypothetical protein RFI_11334, partial [Reticulomyxa filosa]
MMTKTAPAKATSARPDKSESTIADKFKRQKKATKNTMSITHVRKESGTPSHHTMSSLALLAANNPQAMDELTRMSVDMRSQKEIDRLQKMIQQKETQFQSALEIADQLNVANIKVNYDTRTHTCLKNVEFPFPITLTSLSAKLFFFLNLRIRIRMCILDGFPTYFMCHQKNNGQIVEKPSSNENNLLQAKLRTVEDRYEKDIQQLQTGLEEHTQMVIQLQQELVNKEKTLQIIEQQHLANMREKFNNGDTLTSIENGDYMTSIPSNASNTQVSSASREKEQELRKQLEEEMRRTDDLVKERNQLYDKIDELSRASLALERLQDE